MLNMLHLVRNVDFSTYTLIIPCISVGNVPQLSVDLLIATYNSKRISRIWHPAIVSSVGYDPYNSNMLDICTGCELYINEELKLASIQIRSAIENKLALKFFCDLRTAVTSLNFKCVFILSSAFDYELHNIMSEKFYFVSNDITNEEMEKHSIKPLQQNVNGKYYLNGGGFAVKLYEIIKEVLPCTLLTKYVSEGDNRPDAFLTLQRLFNVLGFNFSENVKYPSSWQFVFGGPPPLGIY